MACARRPPFGPHPQCGAYRGSVLNLRACFVKTFQWLPSKAKQKGSARSLFLYEILAGSAGLRLVFVGAKTARGQGLKGIDARLPARGQGLVHGRKAVRQARSHIEASMGIYRDCR